MDVKIIFCSQTCNNFHMKQNLPKHCSKCERKNLSDISSYLLKLNQRYSDRKGCKNTIIIYYKHKLNKTSWPVSITV